MIVGGVLSTRSNVNVQLLEFSVQSVAVRVTVNEYGGAVTVEPGAGTCVTVIGPGHASETIALPVRSGMTPVQFGPRKSFAVASVQVICGGVVSRTVIVCGQEAVWPQASVAVHVRVITPVLPQTAAKESLDEIVTALHESTPVAKPDAAGAVDEPHSTVTFGGQVTVGFVVSTIVIVWLHDDV